MSSQGLAGVIAAETSISTIVDGALLYRGVPIEVVVAEGRFSEVVYWLWHGALPTAAELSRVEAALERAWELPREVVTRLRGLPPTTPMLVALREGVNGLALLATAPAADARAAVTAAATLVGALPAMAAQFHHVAAGRPLFAPRTSGSLAERFLHAVRGEPAGPEEVRAFDQALILSADHELNASTFTARIVASTRADIYSAVIAALCTLKGPLHGGAISGVWELLERVEEASDIQGEVEARLEARERIPGFGHRVYPGPDPRAAQFRELATRLGGAGVAEADRLAAVVQERLDLYPNTDFYAAVFYRVLGLPVDVAPAVFALGRMAGWTAHVLEQYNNNKLIRPRAQWTGSTDARWVPLRERGGV